MEERNVNLAREALALTACGTCFCLVLREDWDGHAEWHQRLAGAVRGEKAP
jgi:hypothetical protein